MREAHFLSSCKNILGGGNCYYIILLPFTSFTIFVVVSVNANHMMHICKQPSQKHKLEWVVYFFFSAKKNYDAVLCHISDMYRMILNRWTKYIDCTRYYVLGFFFSDEKRGRIIVLTPLELFFPRFFVDFCVCVCVDWVNCLYSGINRLRGKKVYFNPILTSIRTRNIMNLIWTTVQFK